MMLLSFLGPITTCAFDADIGSEAMLTSCVFFGVLGGNILFGSLGDLYGRRFSIIVSILISGAAGILSATASTFIMVL